jgi:hypothetical protein
MTTTMMLLIVAPDGVGDGLGPGFVLTPPHPIVASKAMLKKKPMVRVNVCYLRVFETGFLRAVGLRVTGFWRKLW